MKKLSPDFDLSILIASRNEMFLKNTIDNVLENIKGKTEIIVVCDGDWPVEPIPNHERVTMVRHNESIGQRAAINEAARLSNAKYVMKLDAHCSVGEGFDVAMMEDMQDDWTMVPKMYNLHAFDWVCANGHKRYQGKSGVCTECGEPTERDILWRAKPSPETTSMLFDGDMRFGYWGKYKGNQQGDLVDTMSLLGACWMATREKFWELELCDEAHGSWGQMGTEVACKTWLSGGRLVCTKKTWFAHMFRTQGGDFGFPYPNPGVTKARRFSRDLWMNDKWDKAIHPLSWIIDKFGPVPGWEDMTKGILYYTDNRLNKKIMVACQNQLEKAVGNNRIVSVSLERVDIGDNIVIPLERGILTMFKQILAGLKDLDSDVVFFCEHDVLYHPSHFDLRIQDKQKYYYNTNVWKVRLDDGHAMRTSFCQQTSGLCANRELLIEHYEKRIEMVEKHGYSRKMGFEPGTHGRGERVDDYKSESWESKYPNIDIRHGFNLTPSRWSKDQFRNARYTRGWQEADEIPGWGVVKGKFREVIEEMANG